MVDFTMLEVTWPLITVKYLTRHSTLLIASDLSSAANEYGYTEVFVNGYLHLPDIRICRRRSSLVWVVQAVQKMLLMQWSMLIPRTSSFLLSSDKLPEGLDGLKMKFDYFHCWGACMFLLYELIHRLAVIAQHCKRKYSQHRPLWSLKDIWVELQFFCQKPSRNNWNNFFGFLGSNNSWIYWFYMYPIWFFFRKKYTWRLMVNSNWSLRRK